MTEILLLAVVVLLAVIAWQNRRGTWPKVVLPWARETAEVGMSTASNARPVTFSIDGQQVIASKSRGVITLSLSMNDDVLKSEIENDPASLGYAPYVLQQNYPAIAALLNAVPQIPNPVPQGTIPKRFKLYDLLDKVTQAEALEVIKLPGLLTYLDSALGANDRTTTNKLLGYIASMFSAATKTAVATLLAQTEADPDWKATIAGTSRAASIGLSVVRDMDVQRVLQ